MKRPAHTGQRIRKETRAGAATAPLLTVAILLVLLFSLSSLDLTEPSNVTLPASAAPTMPEAANPPAAGTIQLASHEAESLVQHADHTHLLVDSFEPLVDGSETPALIPDHVAIRVLMQTLSLPPNASEAERRELSARTSRMRLSDADMAVLVRELGVFHLRATEQKARTEALRPNTVGFSPAAVSRFASEHSRLGQMAGEAYNGLLRTLSPDGAAKLAEHLTHVKTRMKIYPTPDMSSDVR